MSDLKTRATKAALLGMHYSGIASALAPIAEGTGIIFMLHRVCPEPAEAFEPNRILKVTPRLLEETILAVRRAGIDIVSLDEAHRRLVAGETVRRFACFTLDDGYRDNLEHARPVFSRHQVPFTVYVPSDFPDGAGFLWWLALEGVIRRSDLVEVNLGDGLKEHPCRTIAEKEEAFQAIYRRLRTMPEPAARQIMRRLCDRHRYDADGEARSLVLDWDGLRELARDPLATIGAHTRSHMALAQLDAAAARAEIVDGADRLAEMLGRRPEHLSYPYGCRLAAGWRELDLARAIGFKTAVTTRKGLVFPGHKDHLTALPRLSLNGDFQDLRYVETLATGAPFLLLNRLKRLVTV